MSVAVIAVHDTKARARCVAIVAKQSHLGAIGVNNWLELEQVLESDCDVGLIVFQALLPGAPAEAIARLADQSCKLAIITEDGEPSTLPEGASGLEQPVPEEALVLLACAAEHQNKGLQGTFNPVDIVQVVCMSEETHVLLISHNHVDVGVIEVRKGTLWTAYDSLGVGKEAFARLMQPAMRARACVHQELSEQRSITAGHEKIILDSLRLVDQGELTIPPPLLGSGMYRAAAKPQRDSETIELENQARQHLTERNYSQATRTLVRLAERDPSSKLVLANLAQLNSLGYPND